MEGKGEEIGQMEAEGKGEGLRSEMEAKGWDRRSGSWEREADVWERLGLKILEENSI